MNTKRSYLLGLFLAFCFFNLGLYAQQTLTVNVTGTPACDHDGTATATVSGGVPPYMYIWYYNGQQDTTFTPTVTGLAGGFVYLTVYDAATGYGWGNVYVTPPFQLNMTTTPDTCGQNTGTATINVSGGTAPFTYLWDNNQTTQTATGLSAGLHDVSVTDALGCNMLFSETDSGFIQVPNFSPITVTTTNTPSSCNDGTATITPSNGTAPYSYYWDTNPVQTTQTATNLPSGSVTVRVTDATGCYIDWWAWVPQGLSPINLTGTATPETCTQANGTASISASGGTPPYTYLWSTGATTTSISGLSYGSYQVTVTDNAGCTNSTTKFVGRTTPISLSLAPVDPSCGNQDGTVAATPSGGTPPYSYLWNDGQTTQTATALGPGYAQVTVTDANGCTKSRYTYLSYSASCFGTISGRVWYDQNGNCTQDPVDQGMNGVFIDFTPGGYVRTNSSGYYSYQPVPGTYTVAQVVPSYFQQNCPSSPSTYTANIPTTGSVSTGNDFWDEPVGVVNDLRVSMYCGLARPGRSQLVRLYYWNDGNTLLNATLNFTHDAGHIYTSASPSATNYTVGTRTATWNLGTLYPGDQGYVTAWMYIPTSATVGSSLRDTLEILPIVGDTTPANNTRICSRTVTTSYDPNTKSVDPPGLINATQSPLFYTIEFQNTGNDTAFTVEIRDTLDANLDPLTFKEGGSSHPYTVQLTSPGHLTFTFDNIMLPDSNVNEPGSKGWVSFFIELQPGLSAGTQIPNSASIYFDYNVPVKTNTTINTIDGVLDIEGNPPADPGIVMDPSQTYVLLYPNPTSSRSELEFHLAKSAHVSWSVYDVRGKEVHSARPGLLATGIHKESLDVSRLGAGIYTVKILAGSEVFISKLVVQ